ncbi:hypothetical protein D3C85_583240 [compost metagenome]
MPRRVGGADEPVAVPAARDDDGIGGAGEDAGVGLQRLRPQQDVHALRGLHPEAVGARALLDVVGPDAGGADHRAGGQAMPFAGEGVLHHDARDALAVLDELDHGRPRDDPGAATGRRAHDREGVARVVHQRVVELNAADHAPRIDRRDVPLERRPAEVALARDGTALQAEEVVEQHAGRDIGPLPPGAGERIEKRLRAGNVRAQDLDHQVALFDRMRHQLEVELLEVAQAAVKGLARTRRSAGGDVTRLDQHHRESARDGIERGARAGHARADHQHVGHAARGFGQVAPPLRGMEPGRVGGLEGPRQHGGRDEVVHRISCAAASRWARRMSARACQGALACCAVSRYCP